MSKPITQEQLNRMYWIFESSPRKEQVIAKVKHFYKTDDGENWYNYYRPIYLLIKSDALKKWYRYNFPF